MVSRAASRRRRLARLRTTAPPIRRVAVKPTRMAADPADGVVDRDLRVFGTSNLYVAGASVFTTGGHANPTFTAVALALRLGAHLAAGERRSVGSQLRPETPALSPEV